MDSFLGGAAGFGSSVPDYGSVGAGYTGDFFSGPESGGGLGSAVLEGLGRGILGSLGGGSSRSGAGYRDRVSYTDRTRGDIQNLLAMALRSFETPESLI